MYRAQDYISGYGQKENPSTSVLPYLKAQAKRDKAGQNISVDGDQNPNAEDTYNDARRKIISGEE